MTSKPPQPLVVYDIDVVYCIFQETGDTKQYINPSTAPGHYLCPTRPIVDSIFIKLLRPEQNDRQFVNGGFNFVFSH